MNRSKNEALQLQPCTNVKVRLLSERFKAMIICFQLLVELIPYTMVKDYRTYSLVSYIIYIIVLPIVCVVGLVGCALLLYQVKRDCLLQKGNTYIVQLCQRRWRHTNRQRVHVTMLTIYDCILILSSLCAYSKLYP